MLPKVDTPVRPLPTVEAPGASAPLSGTKDVVGRLTQLMVGRQLQGEIISRMNDGSFVVRLDGATARMALPPGAKPGDTLPMTLLKANPPTFEVETSQGRSTTTASLSRQDLIENILHDTEAENLPGTPAEAKQGPVANYLAGARQATAQAITGQEAVTSAGQAAQAAEAGSTPTVLSSAGRLIDQILHAAQEQGTTAAVVAKVPLANTASELARPEQFAATLQKSLQGSGLFYESHVADWAAGKLPMADLMREPQAQISSMLSQSGELSTDNLPKHTEMAQLINQQLDTLEQQRVVWQGQLLPGQKMEWAVTQERQAGKQRQGQDAESAWQSTVRFELPQLGSIAATINLRGDHLQIFMRAGSDAAVAALQQHGPELAQSLQQAGTQLDAFSVKQDDAA